MKIKKTFKILKQKKEGGLMPFLVIGDPDYSTSLQIAKTICQHSDMLELGIPFSDPIADGPTIQAADVRALKEGINTDIAFRFIKELRKSIDIPIGLLVYYNLVYQRGIETFYKDAKESGVDSILIADLPFEESRIVLSAARKYKIDTVFMISPLTVETRMKKILKFTKGFVYIVSRLGITGAKSNLQSSTLDLIKRIRKKTKLPLCVGFGISKPKHVKSVLKAGADCSIVGSAVTDIISKNLKNKRLMLYKLEKYIKEMKKATKI